MKTFVVFVLLFAAVYCKPVKFSASSSESSEEQSVIRTPPPILKGAADPVPAQALQASDSDDDDDDDDDSDEDTDGKDSVDNDTDSSDSSESQETQPTLAPTSTMETEVPADPTARGDNVQNFADYKKVIIYEDANKIVVKEPFPYKSYGSEKMSPVSKKMSPYDTHDANDVEKHLKVHKALQVHNDVLDEEGASTPEEEGLGLDPSSGIDEGERTKFQADESESTSANDGTGESASASEEENKESDSSRSSEEATETPGAADGESESSQSAESDESDESQQTVEATTEVLDVIIAK